MTLEPNSNGQKEANNGLLAAKPGGGSLGATLYHAGGHGAHTFIGETCAHYLTSWKMLLAGI
eukprot:scaffold166824_cov14-Tisochrysis_lutea.AAC.3